MTARIWTAGITKGRRTLALVVLALVAAPLQFVLTSSATAAPGDGTITVTVIREVNGNGTHEPDLEPGVAGIGVTVEDGDGGSIDATTDATGAVVIDPASLSGSRYRVRVVIPEDKNHLQAAPAGGLDPMISYVDVADGNNADLTVGVWNPVDYVQPSPDYVVGVHSNLGLINPPDPATSRAVQRYGWDDRFAPADITDPGSLVLGSPVARQPSVGTTNGLAYQRDTGNLFMAAYAKRHAAYGPGGPGAIYVTRADGSGSPTLFTTVPNAGTTAHSADLLTDFDFWDAPGKESLGGIDLSVDGTELYVVNLKDRQLYTYDATQPTAAAPLSAVAIPDPGCNAPGDWRPFAVTVRDGIFVGGICTAESLGQGPEARSALQAVIYDWDGASTFTEVFRKTLDFQRGFTSLGFVNDSVPGVGQGRDTHWNSWIPTYTADNVATGLPIDIPGIPGTEVASVSRPQPMLSSIAFDVDGSMVLGFRDRFGDQVALGLPMPPMLGIPPVLPMPAVGTTGGDINKACINPDGTYSWEGTGDCPDNYELISGGPELPGTVEYFPGDWALGVHMEAAQGAVAFPLQQDRVLSTMLDPSLIPFSGGIGFYDRNSGGTGFGELPEGNPFGLDAGPAGIDPRNGNTVTFALFGKSNGLGGLELLAEAAPIQTGGRTWFDENQNGIQDPAEPGLPGVTATLLDPAGAPAAETVSDANGMYYFGPADVLEPNTPYTVTFDYSTADTSGLPGAPDPASLSPAPAGAGDDPAIDSDVGPDGVAPAPTGPSGTSDQTIAAGAVGGPVDPPTGACAVGDTVWSDSNGDGIQDDGEPGVEGVTVALLNPDGTPASDADGTPVPAASTDASGGYLFDNLSCGDYLVRFGAPDGKTFSPAGQGDNPAIDSNPDGTGTTPVFSVGPDDPDSIVDEDPNTAADVVNPTVDAGLVDVQDGDGVVGDFAWMDTDQDGIQDPDEPGAEGVSVTLFTSDGTEVGSTITDAAGTYGFSQLDFGDYYAVFTPPQNSGMEPTTQSADGSTPDDDSNPDGTGQTPPFTVDETTTPEDSIDAGFVDTVAPVAEITSPTAGETTNDPSPTIAGTVDDPTSDVVVTITDADGNVVFEGPATVNDDGTWTATPDADLPDGDYTVVATATDPAGNESSTDPVPFTVDSAAAGERCAIGDFVWDDLNDDGLQDPGEPGVGGVSVALFNPDGSPADDADGNAVAPATTDVDGRFLFDNLSCGDYMVSFAAPDGKTFTSPGVGDDSTADSNPGASGDTPVFSVGPDDPDSTPIDDPGTAADFVNPTIDAGLVDDPNGGGGGGDGPITVTVIRDVNGNTTHEPDLEPGVPGMDVIVEDNDGGSVPSTTDENGLAVIDPSTLNGDQFRVRVVIPDDKDYLQPAPAGGLDPMTSYVDLSDGPVDLTVGVWNPVDYVQPDPDYLVGVHSPLGLINPPDPATSRAVQRYTWADRFAPHDITDPGSLILGSPVASQPAVGTTNGLAYQRDSGNVFMASYAKRHAGYGPDGPGAIYVGPADGSSAPTLFTTVPNAGSTTHSPDLLTDFTFWDAPGKESLGGIDLSADGTELYVVNLNDRQLYTYDATQPTAAAPLAVDPIPDPGCASADDWRPFALSVRDGIFVGGICTAESLGQGPEARSALEAVVYDWDGADTFTEIFRKTLDFQRGFTSLGFANDSVPGVGQGRDTHWNSWIPTYNADNVATGLPIDVPGVPGTEAATVTRPQPILSSIAFDVDGSMILGFRDRFGDQVALGLPLPPTLGFPPVLPMPAVGTTGGDINKACANPDGTYAWEGTGDCPDNNSLIRGGPQLPETVEYFPGDWALGVHMEAAQGAVAFPLQQQDVLSTMLDPSLIPFSGGVGFYDRDTGSTGVGFLPEDNPFGLPGGPAGIDPNNGNTVTFALFGKANGLGGLELLAEAAPIQIGGRTWFDTDQDGIQDPVEPALPGVTATLVDPAGTPVTETVSDDRGLYYFGPDEVLAPDTPYTITFDYSTADTTAVPGTPDPATLTPSPQKVGDDPTIDSDPGPDGVAPATTGPPGTSDQTIDAGAIGDAVQPPTGTCAVGDFVWDDANADGIQDAGEPGVEGVTVALLNPDGSPATDVDGTAVPAATTDAAGGYVFDNLFCDDYLVRFTAPDGKTFSPAAQGTDPAVDSNPDAAGSAPVSVGPDDPDSVPNEDPAVTADFLNSTIDAGVVDAQDGDGVVGDFVWLDVDEDGIQDPDELGVEGASATLFTPDGTEVGSTTTDAGGAYSFTGLPFGDYYVVFEPPADQPDLTPAPQSADGSTPDDDSNPDDTGQTPAFTVDETSTPEDSIDAGYVDTVAPVVEITDPTEGETTNDPTPTIAGTVDDPNSEVVVTITDSDGNVVFEGPATVNEDGTWTVTPDADLPDGDYTVVATATDPAGNEGSAGPVAFTVDSSAVGDDRCAVGDFVWDDTDGDGIQDAGEPGVEGVTVALANPDGSPATDADGTSVPAATTDADGRYLFDNLACGDYLVRFTAPDGKTFSTQQAGDDSSVDSNPDASGEAPVTVGPDDPDSMQDPNTLEFVNSTIDAGVVDAQDGDGVVGDFVWVDVDEDGIQDPDEPGVEGATATLFGADGTEVGSTTTDAGGAYAFTELPFGDYYVVFEPPADQPDLTPAPQSADGSTPDDDSNPDDTGQTPTFTVDETTTPEDSIDAGYVDTVAPVVEITDPTEGETVTDPTPTIAGTVDDPSSEVVVTITDADGNVVFEGPATVNDDGTWSITPDADLPDGDYTVTATATDPAGNEGSAGPVAFTVDSSAGQRAAVGDFVWDDADGDGIQDTGEPGVEGVTVDLLNPDGSPAVDGDGNPVAVATTDADGGYVFDNLAIGDYIVRFTAPDGTTFSPAAQGDDPTVDSNPDAAGSAPVSVGADDPDSVPNEDPGVSADVINPTVDAGLVDAQDGDGVVGDFVWLDVDEDGIQDPDELGVEGALATLFTPDGTEVGSTTTDAGGAYSFTGLPFGDYYVVFEPPADQPDLTPTAQSADGSTPDDDSNPDDTGQTPTFTVDETTTPEDSIDAGYVDTVAPVVEITDPTEGETVNDSTPTIAGTVDDPNSEVVVTITDSDGNVVFEGPATVNEDGTWSVTPDADLPDGDYTVVATATDPAGNEGSAGPVAFTVDSSAVGDDRCAVGDFVWDDTDGDGIQDAGEPGVESVTVALLNPDGSPASDADGTSVPAASTDADGRYLFDNLACGDYLVRFTAPDGTTFSTQQAGDDSSVDSNPDASGEAPVTVGPGDPDSMQDPNTLEFVNSTIDAGVVDAQDGDGVVGDFVWVDVDEDGIQDPDEPGVEGATATLFGADGTEVGSTTTDAGGAYAFTELPFGDYYVVFGPPADSGLEPTTQSADGSTPDDDSNPDDTGQTPTFTVDETTTPEDSIDAGYVDNVAPVVEITDPTEGETVTDPTPTIAGTVDDPNSEVVVTITDADGNVVFEGPATVNDDGTWTITPDADLPDGDYTVVATATDPAGNEGTAGPVAFTVDSSAGQRAAVGDFVWDDADGDGIQDTGEPGVEGVTVDLLNPDGSPADDGDGNPVAMATTDADGGYVFDNLAIGDYIVRFTAPDGKTFSPAAQGDDPTVDSNPDAAGSAPVSVGPDDPDSVPNEDPGVSADVINPTIDAGLVDAQDGDGVVGDFVWLDVDQDGIQDPDEPGVEGATATLFTPDGTEVGSTTTDTGGAYSFTELAFGDYYVVFEPPADQPDLTPTAQSADGSTPDDDSNPDDTGQTPTFTVDETTTPEDSIDAGYVDTVAPVVEITDPTEGETTNDPTPTIAGTVDDPNSEVVVTITDADGNVVFEGPATVNDDGTWTITPDADLPDGDYTVVATATDPAGNEGSAGPVAFTIDSSAVGDDRCAVGDFVWDDADGDGIQDAGEPGVEGVSVALANPDGSPATDADGTSVAAASTDADGRYLFDNLACGDYLVRFSAPDGKAFSPAAQGGDPAADSNPDASGEAPVTVGPDDPDSMPIDDPATAADFVNSTVDAGLVDAQDGDGVVGDFVWLDVDEDGIQDQDEPGVEGASATLFTPDGTEVGSTTTNAGGAYAFTGLDFGDYYVVFEPPADQPDLTPTAQSADGSTPDDDSNPDDTGQTPTFTVDETTTPEDSIDAGYVDTVAPVVEITDPTEGETVTDSTPTIAGTVDDPNSEVVVTITDADGNVVFEGPATVNDDGTWTITPDADLPDGDYTVTATATDPAGNEGTAGPVAFTVDSSAVGDDRCAVGDFVWDDADGDGIQDAGEPGVEGVTVALANPDGSPANDADGTPVPAASTYTSGGYVFDNLTCGDYLVRFTAPDGKTFSPAAQGTDRTRDSNPDPAGEAPVTVGADDPDSVPNENPDIAADFGNPTVDAGLVDAQDGDGVVGDFVWLDVDQDGIQDPDEPGVEGASATLFTPDGTEVGSTTTDTGGAYSFTELPFGDYYVVFEPPADQPDLTPTAQSADGSTPDDDSNPDDTGQTPTFTVDETTTPEDSIDAGYVDKVAPVVEITDPTEGETTNDPTPTIAGTVDDPNSEVVVTITDADGNVVFEGPATVNDDGTWSVTPDADLPDGDYTITATATDPAGNENTAGPVAFTIDSSAVGDDRCAVGDFVWDDTDGDGIQDAGEPGVEGVTVALANPDGSPATDVDGASVPAATTDADGRYLFDNLACGDYLVRFTAPDGTTFTAQQAGDDPAADSNPDASGEAPVTVGPDDPDSSPIDDPDTAADFINPTIDAGLVDDTTPSGGTVSGRAFSDDDRDGLEDPDEPGVEGVTVRLLDGDGNLVGDPTVTDTDGQYALSDVPTGEYVAEFSDIPPGTSFSPANQGSDDTVDSDPTPDPDDPDTATTDPFTLDADNPDDDTIDAGIMPPIAERCAIGDYVWTDSDGDGIQDAGEPGVQGVSVALLNPDGSPATDADGDPVPTVTTDADGAYVFDNLFCDDYLVRFTAPNGRTFTVQQAGDDRSVDSNPDASGETPVFSVGPDDPDTVADDDPSTTADFVNPTIDAGLVDAQDGDGVVGDFVWLDVDEDGIQDPDEPGLEDASVTVFTPDGTEVDSTTTDAGGAYRLTGLDFGDYYAVFEPPADQPDLAPAPQSADGSTPDNDSNPDQSGRTPIFTIDETTTPDDSIDAGYVSDPSEPGELCAVGDYVWDDLDADGVQDDGEPGVEGVTVALMNPDGSPATDADGNEVSAVTTDAEGRYLFDNLSCGDYLVRFTAPDGRNFTTQQAGDDATIDSNPDATGETPVFTVHPDDPETIPNQNPDVNADFGNQTIDAGLVDEDGSQPELTVEFLDPPATVTAGEEFLLQLVFENTGNTPISDINVTIELPDNIEYRACVDGHWGCSSGSVLGRCHGTAQPGQTFPEMHTRLAALSPGQGTIVATVRDATGTVEATTELAIDVVPQGAVKGGTGLRDLARTGMGSMGFMVALIGVVTALALGLLNRRRFGDRMDG